jgi:hypothetical protein
MHIIILPYLIKRYFILISTANLICEMHACMGKCIENYTTALNGTMMKRIIIVQIYTARANHLCVHFLHFALISSIILVSHPPSPDSHEFASMQCTNKMCGCLCLLVLQIHKNKGVLLSCSLNIIKADKEFEQSKI